MTEGAGVFSMGKFWPEDLADPSVRWQISGGLRTLPDARAIELMSSEDSSLRSYGLTGAVVPWSPGVAERAVGLVDDPSEEIRMILAARLAKMRHPRAEELAIRIARNSAWIETVGNAVYALGKVGTEASIPVLQGLLETTAGRGLVPMIDLAIKEIRARVAVDSADGCTSGDPP